MIVYADSSILARAYLADESRHADAQALLDDQASTVITGSWSRVEVSGALVRASRTGRAQMVDEAELLAVWDADVAPGGRVVVMDVDQHQAEAIALALVRAHGLRAMDAWHLAVADLVVRADGLIEAGESVGFASRDFAQAAVARALGFQPR